MTSTSGILSLSKIRSRSPHSETCRIVVDYQGDVEFVVFRVLSDSVRDAMIW